MVGVSGLDLCLKDCSWVESKVIDLFPYDAGTDSGLSYMVIVTTILVTPNFRICRIYEQ